MEFFPAGDIDYVTSDSRQAIIDSWPADVDDSRARQDWDWKPKHDMDLAFSEYLIPEIRRRYGHS